MWQIGFHRLKDRLKMVACKDFRWERIEGQRKARMCPLGQGMVDYPKFFRMFAARGFAGPISLHVEYGVEAPAEAQRIDRTIQAIKTDFRHLRSQFDAAFA